MSRQMVLKFFLITLMVACMGCAATKDVGVRGYIEDKDRVDLEMNGNAGYLLGNAPADYGPKKETRKVFVVEVTKDVDPEAMSGLGYDSGPKKVITYEEPSSSTRKIQSRPGFAPVEIPTIEDDYSDADSGSGVSTRMIQYKVEKDDTLQKISKKFYDSYSKWTKIYQVNKDKIKNPDRIKPGITINIPVE